MEIYSLAIYPLVLSKTITSMKKTLEDRVGWFRSVNSLAHFSIIYFETDEVGYTNVKECVRRFVFGLEGRQINLDRTTLYNNGALVLLPDSESCAYLKIFFRSIAKYLRCVVKMKSITTSPHLTIGREMTKDQQELSIEYLGDTNLTFNCNTLVLRRFNTSKGQYDNIDYFHF